jgi:hypothetical protein
MVKSWVDFTDRGKKLKPERVKAEGSVLTLEPVLVNKFGQRIYVAKNPSSWKMNYSLWAHAGRGWGAMVVSQHKTKAAVIVAAKRLANKDVLKVLGWS